MRVVAVFLVSVSGAFVVGACGEPPGPGGTPGRGGATSSGGSSAGGSGSGSTASSGAGSSGSSTTGSSGGGGASGSTGSSGGGSGSSGGSSGGGAPTAGGCTLFPADNPWNTRIDDASKFPVHANSATYLSKMSPSTHLHPDWGDWSTNHYGIPWQVVPSTQPGVPMIFQYATESDPGPYPFPANALVEGGAGSGGDMHVLVIEAGSCLLYETWSSTYASPGWKCGSGAKFALGSNMLRPDGWTSADAAGLPVLPGLVKVAEVKAGAIHHALRFTVANSQQAYIHPATHAAGKADATLPPMGLRLRLHASFDASAFTGPARVIVDAMKQYGLILADNGSNWYVSGDSDDGWTPMMDALVQAFARILGSDFEAVESGPISTAGL
jgi:hypothetical protein